jgi:hypothetical protein
MRATIDIANIFWIDPRLWPVRRTPRFGPWWRKDSKWYWLNAAADKT